MAAVSRRCFKWLATVLLVVTAAAAVPPDDPRQQASQLYAQRDFAGAAAALEKHLGAHPEDDASRMLLGICRQQLGQNVAAEEAFREVVRRNPKEPQARFYLGLSRFFMGRFAEAGDDVQASIELGGDAARAHHLLGMIFEERHQPEQALESYREAIQAKPSGSTDPHLSAGNVLLKLGRAEEAVAHFQSATGIHPQLPETHYHLARAYLELGKVQEAEQSLEKAVALTDHPQARSLLARVRAGEWNRPQAPPKAFAEVAPIRFQNVAQQAGLDFVLENHPTPEKYLPETMAGGVAAFDYDDDGLIDIFFTNGADTPSLNKESSKYSNRLYRNVGEMKFADVTEKAGVRGAGYSIGAAAGDYDNDGHTDLFVAGVRRNILYRNRGDGTFKEVTTDAGIASTHWSVAGGWFDYDNDGLLDLFVVSYLQWSPSVDQYCGDESTKVRTYCHPKFFEGLPNTLYHNRGDGTFEDVSKQSGIAAHAGKGMSVAFADYDQDGDLDVFVTNDAVPNFLFRNRGNGRFDEAGLEAGVALTDDGKAVSSMGVDFRDFDNDTRPDILFTALVGETFPTFRNEGDGLFRDATYATKMGLLSSRYAGWSVGLTDFNNDGWKDVFTANSHVTDNIELFSEEKYRQPNRVFANRGDGTFEDASAGAGEEFGVARAHRGTAFADFDNDGRIDVVVSALGEPAELWRNVSPNPRRWIRLHLEGTRSNRDGIGAQVLVGNQHNAMTSSTGYASSSLSAVHFGLGPMEVIPRVEIRWPSGTRQLIEQVETNRVISIREPAE